MRCSIAVITNLLCICVCVYYTLFIYILFNVGLGGILSRHIRQSRVWRILKRGGRLLRLKFKMRGKAKKKTTEKG